ncbi:hypothetical protein VSDG_01943 [Cytospora chrysosperma]|uniref:Rit1 N-terminal domain-containing protein n=1 Tax=Cytospora chrysosperma TaxID=252740 RepID=A0A423WHS6_CYTCH|nr:hypothetical protein VSDG_01943 [Valsa sordida]
MSALTDLIFPNQESNTNNINKILGDLKRSNLSITNRLRSIHEDAGFVEGIAAATPRPLVANERCGSWYIRPELKTASAYFKSTDGHTGQWKFSTRRLNLHLLPLIERHDGIIIVDSTRRGKRMPDSLSKTVPIWCCVLNRALFPDLAPECHGLHVPPNVVSDSERSQMLARVPGFVASFRELNPDLAGLRAQISRPLRPTWVTQETVQMGRLEEDLGIGRGGGGGGDGGDGVIFESFRPVVCCTSSRRVTGGEMSGHSGYVQGAGDDTENWALDLTPPVFWANLGRLLSTPEADLPGLIRSLVAAAGHQDDHRDSATPADDTDSNGGNKNNIRLPTTVRQLTPYIYVCPLPIPESLPTTEEGAELDWCKIELSSSTTPPETWVNNDGDEVDGQAQKKTKTKERRIIIADEAGGKDLSIGVALALICCCFGDEEGRVLRGTTGEAGGGGNGVGAGVAFNKTMIKVRLGRIMTTMPDANPNRATLQSVNSFLMDWR